MSGGMIGGPVCKEKIGKGLIPSATGAPEPEIVAYLWEVVEQIGRAWSVGDAAERETRSQFRECIAVKCSKSPSYLEEYKSGLLVHEELIDQFKGVNEAYEELFFKNGITDAHEGTRLFHFKRNVVDELMTVVVVSGGFRTFGAHNYKGFIGGSRFKLQAPYRTAKGQS